jgi:hypothetical protein
MIADGHEPNSLSLRRLMRGFPIRWDEQRAEMGNREIAPEHPEVHE